MDSRSTNEAVSRNGANPAGASHRGTRQSQMLADARASVCGFLANLIGRRIKDVAEALYPDLGPIEAEKHLNRNLRGDQGRKVGASEIDAILDVLGREDEEKWFRFTMRRRGIHPPDKFERDGEVERLLAENEKLRRDNEEKDAAIRELAEAFAHKEDA